MTLIIILEFILWYSESDEGHKICFSVLCNSDKFMHGIYFICIHWININRKLVCLFAEAGWDWLSVKK
jgi:hypothetical protein